MSMIDRRGLLIGGACLAALPSAVQAGLPVPPGGRLGFDIIRKGTRLGAHVLTFEQAGDALAVRVKVDLVIKLGFLTLYRYSHRATERWTGDQVTGLDSATDDDGRKYSVTGRRDATGLVIESNVTPRYVAPADALPATHWNRRQLGGPWINTQDGKLVRPKVAAEGNDAVPTVAGALIRASRFVLTGDVEMETWYDPQPSWAGLRFKAKDGSLVRYLRQ